VHACRDVASTALFSDPTRSLSSSGWSSLLGTEAPCTGTGTTRMPRRCSIPTSVRTQSSGSSNRRRPRVDSAFTQRQEIQRNQRENMSLHQGVSVSSFAPVALEKSSESRPAQCLCSSTRPERTSGKTSWNRASGSAQAVRAARRWNASASPGASSVPSDARLGVTLGAAVGAIDSVAAAAGVPSGTPASAVTCPRSNAFGASAP
jgi:hypothetical protein